MRLAELLASTVVDGGGSPVGRVRDVELVQDGPLIEGFGHGLRVDALAVGTAGILVRLGRRSARPTRYRWADVERWDAEAKRLHLVAGAAPLG